jgi:hypothetical protein
MNVRNHFTISLTKLNGVQSGAANRLKMKPYRSTAER